MPDDVDAIRARIDIVDLVGQQVSLKQAGKNWKGLCPFHDDKHPSFDVSPRTGTYRCWSCGEKGDIFNWVMRTQNVDFSEALKILAVQAGVTLKRGHQTQPSLVESRQGAMEDSLAFFRAELDKSEIAQKYSDQRGLNKDVRDTWEIGYSPDVGEALAMCLQKKGHKLSDCKELFLVDTDSSGGYYDKFRGRLMIPIRDERSALVAFGGRIIGDGQPKYINSGDTPLYRKSRVLYGMNRAKDAIAKKDQAVLVEGYLDVIACHIGGATTAVASLGTSLTNEQAKLLKRWCKEVVILYDGDAAGQRATERAIDVLHAEGLRVRIALMATGADPDTVLKSDGAAGIVSLIDKAITPIDYRILRLEKSMDPQQNEFWVEVAKLLADLPTDREIELYVRQLSLRHATKVDVSSVSDALKRDVKRLRRERGPGVNYRKGFPAATSSYLEGNSLSIPERVVFGALLEEGLKEYAWPYVREEDLFETHKGREIAATLLKSFSEPPNGPPSVWLFQIEDEEMRSIISSCEVQNVLETNIKQFFLDSIEKLRRERVNRNVAIMRQGAIGEKESKDILEILKLKHGSSQPDSKRSS